MTRDINAIYNSKINAIHNRVNTRIAEINKNANVSFKMHYHNEIIIQPATADITDSCSKAGQVVPNAAGGADYDAVINKMSRKYGVDNNLIKAVIKAESGFNPKAVSGAGASGLMQLMPSTAAGLGVKDVFDPEQNIEGGVSYLKGQINRFGGDVKMALAAYNCGPNRLKNLDIYNLNDQAQLSKLPVETQNYIKKIYGYMNKAV